MCVGVHLNRFKVIVDLKRGLMHDYQYPDSKMLEVHRQSTGICAHWQYAGILLLFHHILNISQMAKTAHNVKRAAGCWRTAGELTSTNGPPAACYQGIQGLVAFDDTCLVCFPQQLCKRRPWHFLHHLQDSRYVPFWKFAKTAISVGHSHPLISNL